MKNKDNEPNVERIQSLSLERLKISQQIKELEFKAAKLDGDLVAAGLKLSDLAYR